MIPSRNLLDDHTFMGLKRYCYSTSERREFNFCLDTSHPWVQAQQKQNIQRVRILCVKCALDFCLSNTLYVFQKLGVSGNRSPILSLTIELENAYCHQGNQIPKAKTAYLVLVMHIAIIIECLCSSLLSDMISYFCFLLLVITFCSWMVGICLFSDSLETLSIQFEVSLKVWFCNASLHCPWLVTHKPNS